MVSPVDGCIYQVGYFNDRKVINVKGMDLIVTDLLGTKVNNNLFHHGAYINIYLSPADYHRVHMPIAGKLLQMAYIPGKLFSVNNHIAEAMPNLFTNNERVITIFQTKFGYMAIILVGAIFVGNIVTSWAGNINSDHKKQPFSIFYSTLPNKDVYLDMGQELGYFQMGSTVIVLLATEKVAWLINTTNNKNIKMGQQIGVIT
jgi:phosphatidylserine decarboxylase